MTFFSESDLTPWFDGAKEKPTIEGYYMLRSGDGGHVGFQKWDGALWGQWYLTMEEAVDAEERGGLEPVASMYQNDPWRGLKAPANELLRARVPGVAPAAFALAKSSARV